MRDLQTDLYVKISIAERYDPIYMVYLQSNKKMNLDLVVRSLSKSATN